MPIYKPQTHKGPVVLLESEPSSPPTMTLSDGRVITAVRGDQAGGVYKGHEGWQFVFPRDILGQEDAVLTVDGKTQNIDYTNTSYRGNAIGSLQESTKGSIGDVGSMSQGIAPGFAGGSVGYGVVPEFLGSLFPDASTIKAKGLKTKVADYNFTDPIEFASRFGQYQRGELDKNFAQSKKFAMETVENELQALTNYVPRSAALKREQVAQDNTFNQAQRTAQVMGAIPDVVGDLNAIAGDARAYASGRMPDSIGDRALELGNRSAAADIAASSGFGVGSSAARKVSDLMSAKDRIGLSQYGNQLLGQNAAQRAELLLAPTSYSNAGEQINVLPSQSVSALQTQAFGDLNQSTLTTPGQALQTQVQQEQFRTSNQMQVDQFNANMKFNVRNTNAAIKNNFALTKFNYLVGYANSVAAAGQANMNTIVGLEQQEAARNESSKQKNKTQKGNTIAKGIETVGKIVGGALGFG